MPIMKRFCASSTDLRTRTADRASEYGGGRTGTSERRDEWLADSPAPESTRSLRGRQLPAPPAPATAGAGASHGIVGHRTPLSLSSTRVVLPRPRKTAYADLFDEIRRYSEGDLQTRHARRGSYRRASSTTCSPSSSPPSSSSRPLPPPPLPDSPFAYRSSPSSGSSLETLGCYSSSLNLLASLHSSQKLRMYDSATAKEKARRLAFENLATEVMFSDDLGNHPPPFVRSFLA